MPTLRPLLLLLAALSGPVAAQGERVLRVCMTDTPHEPWRYTVDGRVHKGLDHELLNRFGQRSGWRVALQTVSGRRCLIELQQGRADATVGLSHNAERAAYVRYPMRGGRPDPALALRMDGYSLYHRPGFALQWDGQSLRLPPGSVVEVLSGQSVIGDLKRRGVEFVERGREAEHSLQRLVDGQAQKAEILSRGAALHQALPRQDHRRQVRRQRHDRPRTCSRCFAEDVVLLKLVGLNPVVVHGGGPQIESVLAPSARRASSSRACASPTPRPWNRRMVLGGQVNKEIVGLINQAGGKAVGLTGKDGASSAPRSC
jgi:hypothetical protein